MTDTLIYINVLGPSDVVGATVIVLNNSSQVVFSGITNSDFYVSVTLPDGNYSATASKAGFITQRQNFSEPGTYSIGFNMIRDTTDGGAAVGEVYAIRVQDIANQRWFNWDKPPGFWGVAPSLIPPGAGNLYVAFYVANRGSGGGNLTLTLKETYTGTVLATKTGYVDVNWGMGMEWTGTMPASTYYLSCIVSP